jgi:MscS family membrane protein
MNGCNWKKKHVGLQAITFSIIMLFFMMIFIGTGTLYAQPSLTEVVEGSTKKGEEVEIEVSLGGMVPEDELQRGMPRGTVRGFFLAVRQRDFEKAAKYLDLRHLPEDVKKIGGPELAHEFRKVLARTLWVNLDKLSLDPNGHMQDGLPTYRDRVGRIHAKSKNFDILLQKVPRGDGVSIWKFSNRTIAQVPEMYAIFGRGFVDQLLPAWFFQIRAFEIYLGEWLGVIAIGLLGYLLAVGLTGPLYYWMGRQERPLYAQLLTSFRRPFRLIVWALIGNQLMPFLNLSLVAQALHQAKTITFIIGAWFAMRIIDFGCVRLALRMKKKGRPGLSVLLPTLGNVLKIVLAIAVGILWLDNIGVKVGALLAGLGIGGLAVALAAQKSLENVIGAITLYASRPVKVGDFCRFGDSYGTVEEIGLRATKVRTHDSTVINIPNAEFSTIQLENYSMRKHMWYHPTIRLRYETTPDQLRYVLVEVRKMFYSHPKVLQSPARIRFEGFGEHSLDLQVFAFLDVNNPDNFTEVAEDLNLRIMDIVAEAGTEFAIPSQTLYVQRGAGLDQEKVEAAENRVKTWKANNALYLPSFPQETIEELQASLDYPPAGSPGSVPR